MLNLTRSWISGRIASVGRCAMILPVLAQAQKTAAEAPAADSEGGAWPVIDWLLVAVLVCGALFLVCRSSRRN